MRSINIKILKSKGWIHNKDTNSWSHPQHDFEVNLDKINEGLLRFWELYKNDIYVRCLKEKGNFIPTKEFRERQRKWEKEYGIY